MFICSENLVLKQFVSILVLSTVQEIETKQKEVGRGGTLEKYQDFSTQEGRMIKGSYRS